MKIGFDGKRALHNLRGLGNYSRTLIKSLDIHFPENEYLLFSTDASNDELREWGDSLSSSSKIIGPQGTLTKSLPSVWRSLLLNNDLKKHDLDVYHGLSHEIPPGIKSSNFLKVVTIHDLLYLKFPQNFSVIDRNVYHRKFLYSARSADIVVAICEQTKRDIIEYLKIPEEKIHVVYQSCSPDFYETVSDSIKDEVAKKYSISGEYVFHVAAMEPNKNTLSIVKAFEKIKDDISYDLILVGRGGEYKQKVIEYIKSQGLSSRVKILEDVPMADLPALYQMASLFVFPSFYEGFGIPIIEAQFCNTPVITSKGSCFPESGGPASRYIDPSDVTEISNVMREVLKDDTLKKEMAQKGHEFVQKFHWKNTSKNLLDLYSTHL
jgi:glycosyltransferase involved in cell wall biosynthesis